MRFSLIIALLPLALAAPVKRDAGSLVSGLTGTGSATDVVGDLLSGVTGAAAAVTSGDLVSGVTGEVGSLLGGLKD